MFDADGPADVVRQDSTDAGEPEKFFFHQAKLGGAAGAVFCLLALAGLALQSFVRGARATNA
ncbi:hypothetical protein [Variovorax gossypii]